MTRSIMFASRLWVVGIAFFIAHEAVFAGSTDIEIFLVGDTNDAKIGEGVQVDLDKLEKVINEAYNANLERFRDHLRLNILSGDQVSPNSIRRQFERLRNKDLSSTTILFYYAGHGGWDKDKGHFLAIDNGNKSMLRSEIRNHLQDLRPRAAFIITDCCSNYANFSPPERRIPAKWKVFNDLFLECSPGFVDFTGATESQFGWTNSRDGGFFTCALTKLLCEPRDQLRDDGEDSFISWDTFFPKVRSLTDSIFDKAKEASAEGSEIRDSNAQQPQAYFLNSWPKNFRRRLVVHNNTGVKICVWLQYYDVDFSTFEYKWYYPTSSGRFYEIPSGKKIGLNDDGIPISAKSVRLWANQVNGTLIWHKYKDSTLNLVDDEGYSGPIEDYVYTFN